MPDFLLRKDTGELELVTGTEPFTVSPTAGGGTYDVYRLDNGGSVTLAASDTQAPDISNLTVMVTNDDAVLEWSTTEASGSAYWVCTTQVDMPDPEQIIAGQDHTGAAAEASGVQSVTTTGPQTSQPVSGLIEGESYAFHLLQQDASGNTSAILTNTALVPNDDDIAPALRYLEASASGTTATLTLSSDEANGMLYWVLNEQAQQPDASQLAAGLGADGSSPFANGTQPVTQTDAQPAIVVAGLVPNTTYYFHVMHRDVAGNDSAIDSVDFLATDIQAPTLSGVGVALSGSTATLNWSSDEGNGTGYWVCSTSATVPTEAQVIAGNDHTGATALASGMQVISSAGSQAEQVVTGLSEGPTYFFHLLHQDDSGNSSPVVSTTGVIVSSASAVINIVNRSADRVAPEGFLFDVTLSGFDTPAGQAGGYNEQLHELYYLWDFGDAGYFTAPENLPEAHKDADRAYGPLVSHTYRTAGNYTVSCLVVEPSSGKSTVASINITVGNPEASFGGVNTIFVDTTGAGAGAPAGALITTSLAAAYATASGQDATPKRIMLKRGQTFSFAGANLAFVPTLHIVAEPGAGAKPIVTMGGQIVWTNGSGSGLPKDFVAQGIDWRGPYDSSTSAGTRFPLFQILQNPPETALFDQCDMSGFQQALVTEDIDGTGRNAVLIANDNHITNWHSYAIYGAYGKIVITGNRLAAPQNALSGNGPDGVQGGPIRLPLPTHTVIHSNDLFSNGGWFTNVPDFYTTQPTIRWMTSPVAGAVLNMQANGLEAGFSCLDCVSGPPAAGQPVNAVVEKNIMVGNHMSVTFGRFQYGGMTIRNNVCLMPRVQRVAGVFNPGSFFWLINNPTGSTANLSAPMRIYNNTLVNLMDNSTTYIDQWTPSAQPLPVTSNPGFTSVLEANNVIHQPNLPNPIIGDAPLSVEGLWDARYAGYVDPDTPRVTATITPNDTPALYRPTTGSDALGDAINGPVAFDDFFGNPRPQYPSRGALEMP
jgi:hypothetical protein